MEYAAICQSAAHLLTLASAGHPTTKEKMELPRTPWRWCYTTSASRIPSPAKISMLAFSPLKCSSLCTVCSDHLWACSIQGPQLQVATLKAWTSSQPVVDWPGIFAQKAGHEVWLRNSSHKTPNYILSLQYLRQLRFTAHVVLQEAGAHHSLNKSVRIVANFSHACYRTGGNWKSLLSEEYTELCEDLAADQLWPAKSGNVPNKPSAVLQRISTRRTRGDVWWHMTTVVFPEPLDKLHQSALYQALPWPSCMSVLPLSLSCSAVEGYMLLRKGWLCQSLQANRPNPSPTRLSLWPLISSLLVSSQSAQPPAVPITTARQAPKTAFMWWPHVTLSYTASRFSHKIPSTSRCKCQRLWLGKGLHYRHPEQLPCTSFWTAIWLAHRTLTLQWHSCKSIFVLGQPNCGSDRTALTLQHH